MPGDFTSFLLQYPPDELMAMFRQLSARTLAFASGTFGEGDTVARLTCPSTSRTHSHRMGMLKQTALLFFLLGMAFSQTPSVEVHLDDIRGREVKCTTEVPTDFSCAIFFGVDPPIHDGIDIASVVGGEGGNLPQGPPAPVIREVSLILDGTLYTAVYDPPLKRDEKFSGLKRNVGIPARVDGDALFVKWPRR